MLNTIFLSAYIFSSFGKVFFILLLGIFFLLLILKFDLYIKISFLKVFFIFLAVNILNLIQLTILNPSINSFFYFISKVTIFYIISLSIFLNNEYYREKFFAHLVYIGVFFVIASLLYSQNFTTGYKGIIGNRNEFGILLATIFGVLYLYKDNHNIYEKFFMAVLIFLILMCGSRNALIGVLLSWFFKHGLSWKAVSIIPIFLAAYFLLDYLQIESTITRVSKEEDVLHNRSMEFYYAWKSFLNKPWLGYGLEHYAYIDQSLVPRYLILKYGMVMSHNSYLAGLVMYGLPIFATVFIFIFALVIPAYIKYISSKKFRSLKGATVWFFILTYTFISSIVESHMFGVNAFHGFMFWFSLGIVSWIYYESKSKKYIES